MKKKRNKPFAAAIALLFAANALYSVEATVNAWDTEVVNKPGSEKVEGTLMPGMVVNAERSQGNYTKVSWKGLNGWVRTRNLVFYNNNLFSNVRSVPVLSRKIVNEKGKNFLFYYNRGKFVKYNVTERIQDSVQKVKEITGVYPSTRNDLFLMEGIVKGDDEVHNFQLFTFSSGKTVLIGSYLSYKVTLETFQFSENADYLAAVFTVDGRYIACVYHTGNGELVAYAKQAKRVNWMNNTLLVLNNNEAFWAADVEKLSGPDIGFKPESVIAYVRGDWPVNGEIESKPLDGKLFIRTQNSVAELDVQTKKYQLTRYQSLTISSDRSMNFIYGDKTKTLRSVRTGESVGVFSGEVPKVDFITFADTNVIGRAKFEKIDTLFLYSSEGKELYRYRSIDEPQAYGETGILADIAQDRDLMMLTVEDPWKKEFFLIMEKE